MIGTMLLLTAAITAAVGTVMLIPVWTGISYSWPSFAGLLRFLTSLQHYIRWRSFEPRRLLFTA